MRKLSTLILLFGVLLTFCMTSCQKNENLIVGKWKVVRATGDESYWYFSQDKGSIWTFKENGDCYVTLEGYELYGYYDISDKFLTIMVNFDGSRVVWDLDIDELNKEEMSLSGTFTDDYGDRYRVSYDFDKR